MLWRSRRSVRAEFVRTLATQCQHGRNVAIAMLALWPDQSTGCSYTQAMPQEVVTDVKVHVCCKASKGGKICPRSANVACVLPPPEQERQVIDPSFIQSETALRGTPPVIAQRARRTKPCPVSPVALYFGTVRSRPRRRTRMSESKCRRDCKLTHLAYIIDLLHVVSASTQSRNTAEPKLDTALTVRKLAPPDQGPGCCAVNKTWASKHL